MLLHLLGSLRIIATALCVLIFSSTALHSYIGDNQKVCEIHVFVHGSYGSFFSLLSYPYVKKDAIKGTVYLSIQRMMRDTQLVKYRRFMSGPGIFEVTPGVDIPNNHPARYVIGAFKAMQHEVKPQDLHEHRYFLFGWSGLLSQRERRREAIRLYNELVVLVDKVRAEGKEPLLKIYGHSHGCNVMLNLGLVDACTFDMGQLPLYTEPHTVGCMQRLLDGAATADLKDLLGRNGWQTAEVWYKKPSSRLQCPTSLFLFGMPVQPETAPLVASPLFEKVIQIYSENDGVLASDHISSTRRSAVLIEEKILKGHQNIKVVRWMNDRTPVDECEECLHPKPPKKSRLGPLKDFTGERFKRLQQGGGNPDCHHPLDPTHADFWSIGNKRGGAFFEEVPLLIFTPLLEKFLNTVGEKQTLDFALVGKPDDEAQGALFVHDSVEQYFLHGAQTVPLTPLLWARQGIHRILTVNKKLEVSLKVTSPFFKEWPFFVKKRAG